MTDIVKAVLTDEILSRRPSQTPTTAVRSTLVISIHPKE